MALATTVLPNFTVQLVLELVVSPHEAVNPTEVVGVEKVGGFVVKAQFFGAKVLAT